MNIDKPCHNSFCEPRLQNEGQKKLTDRTDAHGVFDTDFLTFVFSMHRDYKRICKRDRLQLQRK